MRQKPGRENRRREKNLRLLVNAEHFGNPRDLDLFRNVEFCDVKLIPDQFLNTHSHEIEPAPGVKKLVTVSFDGQAVDSAHQRARLVDTAVVFRTQKRTRQHCCRLQKPIQLRLVQDVDSTRRNVIQILNESSGAPYAMLPNFLVQTPERRLY